MGNATFTDHPPGRGPASCYATPGRAMLLIADPAAAATAERAIAAAGGRLLQRVGWDEAPVRLPQIAHAAVVLIETAGVAAATLDTVLPAVRAFLDAVGGPAVVTLTRDQIDLVAGYLLDGQADLLCDPSDAQRIVALVAAGQRAVPTLHDSLSERVQDERDPYRHAGAETDGERLRRLTEGVAQISRYAADLTRPGGMAPTFDLADRRRGYGGEPEGPGQGAGQGVAPQDVRRLIHLRQLRGKFFGQFIGEGLFEDPAWDMLLDLFAAELEGIRVSVSSLCIAAGVAPTTALRWITRMTEMGLFIRHPDPVDRRRAFMALSPRASEAMRAYMLAARKAEAG